MQIATYSNFRWGLYQLLTEHLCWHWILIRVPALRKKKSFPQSFKEGQILTMKNCCSQRFHVFEISETLDVLPYIQNLVQISSLKIIWNVCTSICFVGGKLFWGSPKLMNLITLLAVDALWQIQCLSRGITLYNQHFMNWAAMKTWYLVSLLVYCLHSKSPQNRCGFYCLFFFSSSNLYLKTINCCK